MTSRIYTQGGNILHTYLRVSLLASSTLKSVLPPPPGEAFWRLWSRPPLFEAFLEDLETYVITYKSGLLKLYWQTGCTAAVNMPSLVCSEVYM